MKLIHRRMYWTVVYVANLFVPLMLAKIFVSHRGWVGVFIAVVSYWLVGLHYCGRSRFMTRSLLFGGMIVGFSQLCPILHFLTGMAAVGFTQRLGQTTPQQSHEGEFSSIFSGFLATSITGGLLLAVSLGAGAVVNLMCEGRGNPEKAKPIAKPHIDPELDD